jgi:hypothetical protein
VAPAGAGRRWADVRRRSLSALDETCFFLAADFDKAGWQADVIAFLQACRRLDLDAALERSRSGRGGHVWLFFEDAIPASLARRLGSHVLTEAMESRPDIGLDSYDRFFPNQDTLPQGGFGNLIAWPLQREPRGQGNSVFVDDDLEGWPDQWAFLAGVRKTARVDVERIVQEAERRGRVLGVRLPPQEDGDDAPDDCFEATGGNVADVNVPMLARMFSKRSKAAELERFRNGGKSHESCRLTIAAGVCEPRGPLSARRITSSTASRSLPTSSARKRKTK